MGNRLNELGSMQLLACPFCGAVPEDIEHTLTVWVPHKRGCFLKPCDITPDKQKKWNRRRAKTKLSGLRRPEKEKTNDY